MRGNVVKPVASNGELWGSKPEAMRRNGYYFIEEESSGCRWCGSEIQNQRPKGGGGRRLRCLISVGGSVAEEVENLQEVVC